MSITRLLKGDPEGYHFFSLGDDGVLRVYHSTTYEIIDALRLSPGQIKDWLDRGPFDQAKEDKFRGVDGRSVLDKDMLNPPEGIRLKRPTEEQLQELRRKMEEMNREGVKRVGTCGMRQSNYNLDPI
jgi:hypothetical protein